MKFRRSLFLYALGVALISGTAGCKKKTPIAVVPAPRAVEAPPETRLAEPPRPAPPPPSSLATQTRPVSRPAPPAILPKTIAERLAGEVADAYFDFDKSDLRDDAQQALARDAEALKHILADFADTTLVLEGHCDERGSAEYNVALGDRRARASKDFLTQLGVDVHRILIISYGKERPQCTEANEECMQKNRRVHFVPGETQNSGNE